MLPLTLFYFISSLSVFPFLFRYLQYTGSGFGKLASGQKPSLVFPSATENTNQKGRNSEYLESKPALRLLNQLKQKDMSIDS